MKKGFQLNAELPYIYITKFRNSLVLHPNMMKICHANNIKFILMSNVCIVPVSTKSVKKQVF